MGEGGHLVTMPFRAGEGGKILLLIPEKPHSWSKGLSRGHSPPLRASCPLQYEAVMDRVQKNKLSLYKKVMEVGARFLGCEGCRAQGVGPRRPRMGTWERACLRSLSRNIHVLRVALGTKVPHTSAPALLMEDS